MTKMGGGWRRSEGEKFRVEKTRDRERERRKREREEHAPPILLKILLKILLNILLKIICPIFRNGGSIKIAMCLF